MRKLIYFAALMATPGFAQTVGNSPAPATPALAVITDNILRAGTEIPLITREELTTKKKQLRVGQRFQMEVSANVTQGGVTVVPAGRRGPSD